MADEMVFESKAAEAAHGLVQAYAEAGGPLPATTDALVEWGIAHGKWKKRNSESFATTCRRFEDAMHGVFYRDPQGRIVTLYHGVQQEDDPAPAPAGAGER